MGRTIVHRPEQISVAVENLGVLNFIVELNRRLCGVMERSFLFERVSVD